MRPAATIPIVAMLCAAPALAQDFPRQGYEGASNGQSAPFVGTWGMKFPEPEGTIVSEVIVDCADPIRIEANGEAGIAYLSPEGGRSEFELSAFEGRTAWLPEAAESLIAVWLDSDSFHLHVTNMGRADWDNPRLMFRCEG